MCVNILDLNIPLDPSPLPKVFYVHEEHEKQKNVNAFNLSTEMCILGVSPLLCDK